MSSVYNYQLDGTPLGYVTKIASDMLEGAYLTRGSQNVLISDDGSVETRLGLTVNGQAGSGYLPIRWSDNWITNTDEERDFRSVDDILQVEYNGVWRDIKTGFGNKSRFCGDVWFDRNEIKDKFIFVNGSNKIFSWLGGIAEVDSIVSTSSIKKKDGATAPVTKVANLATAPSVALGAGANSYLSFGFPVGSTTYTQYTAIRGVDGFPDFYTLGFRAGDTIVIAGLGGGLAGNNGTYIIASVIQSTNEIILTTAMPATGTTTVPNPVTITGTTQGSNSGKTFNQARFPTQGTKRFVMQGIVYTYTGGENTDTLTGVTPALPASVPAGTLMFADVYEGIPTSGSIPAGGANYDLLVVSKNQAYIGTTQRREVWISKQDSFIDYGYTVPVRANGEGGIATLDQNLVALYLDEGVVRASCGKSLWYDITLVSVTSNGVAGEEVRVERSKIAYGQGANGQTAITNTKNGVMFLSQEPSIDYLSKVKTFDRTENVPISDPIKPDLIRYDRSNAVSKYFRNYFLCLLPKEGVLLMYDLERKFWQPPQIIPASTMSISSKYGLIFHSNYTNESWNAFIGTNDVGSPILYRAVYNYKNGGARDKYKFSQGYFVEAKITEDTDEIKWEAQFGYKGSQGSISDVFGSLDGDQFIERPLIPAGFGGTPVGQRAYGTYFTDEEDENFLKYRRIFPIVANQNEFFEMQVKFETDKLNAKFKIVAHGTDMIFSESNNSNLIKNIV